MDTPTLLLTPLLALALIAAVMLLSRMAESWQRSRSSSRASAEDRDLIALQDEKQRLLLTLRDLEHEHAMGKVSDEDFAGLKAYFEREALRVIDRIDSHQGSGVGAKPTTGPATEASS